MRWTAQEVVEALIDLHRRGVDINHRTLTEAGHLQLVKAVRQVGGFWHARKLAGLPPPRQQRKRPTLGRSGVLDEILRRQTAGEPLASSRVPPSLQHAGKHHFGSWRAAIVAAGLNYDHIKLNRSYTDTQLLDELRRLWRPEMTVEELRRLPMRSTLCSRFGSLEGALERAGISIE